MKEASELLNEELKSIKDILTSFDEEHTGVPCIMFWCQYIEMVAILLRFIRAIRDGNWTFFLSAFADMLPAMVRS